MTERFSLTIREDGRSRLTLRDIGVFTFRMKVVSVEGPSAPVAPIVIGARMTPKIYGDFARLEFVGRIEGKVTFRAIKAPPKPKAKR